MLRKSFIAVLCLLALGLPYPGYALRCGLQADSKPVCYYVVSNDVKSNEREISILIDEADFSEDTLRILMKHFFDKYPDPQWIRVYVNTHISQMFDFSTTEGPGKKPSQLHPHGALYRKDGNEFIRYKLPDSDLRTIIVKGKDK